MCAMRGFVTSMVLTVCAGQSVVAAEPLPMGMATTPDQIQDDVILDEISVQGYRLSRLRQEIVEAEDRFFALYNDLNTRDEFDIVCQTVQHTGTIMKSRSCFPRIVEIATGAEAEAFADAIDRNSSGDKAARPRATPASVVLAAKSPEYKDNILRLLRKHPELRALVSERDALQRRYDKVRKSK